MRVETLWLSEVETKTLDLGFVGEKNHTQIRIDCANLFYKYPDAEATLAVKPQVGDAYPVVVTKDGTVIIWNVSQGDIAHDGSGQYQLTFTENNEIIKEEFGSYFVKPSLTASGETPDPVEDWIADANGKLAEVDEAIAEIGGAIEDIPDEVDAWLDEHITNPDSPPLDRTLSSSISAAPADMVGDLKSAIGTVPSGETVQGQITDIMSAIQGIGLDIENGVLVISPVTA